MKRRLSLDDIRSLSSDERVGDVPTHFFKSRSLLRNTKSEFFRNLSHNIPKTWNGLPVVYDIWWDTHKEIDSNNLPKIAGFSYSDFLSKCLYFRPTNSHLAKALLVNILQNGSDVDEKIISKVTRNLQDKYKLIRAKHRFHEWPSSVIFLPGTNLLEKHYVDYDKVAELVRSGTKVKPHPLTTKYHMEMLKYRYGADNILNIEHSGHSYALNSEKIYCCSNSELGLVGLLKDKAMELVEVDAPDISFGGYKALYSAIDNSKDKLHVLLSTNLSGIITDSSDKLVANKVEEFMNMFSFFSRIKNETID